ncbi:MAG: hypothetical protein ACR2QM_13995 [Longimicrobiales bacterium]
MSEIPFTWHAVGTAGIEALIQARLEAHWATQLVGATADALLDKAKDDSHTNLFWNRDAHHLEGREIPFAVHGDHGFGRLAVKLHPLALHLGGEAFPLADKTLQDATEWVEHQLAKRVDAAVSLRIRDYDMPDHPVAGGARFAGTDAGSASELGCWFENGTDVLLAVASDLHGVSEIALWPHHFDIGGILFLDPTASADRAPQVGLGLSLGDGHIAEPYFYITPWPTAEGATMEGLSGGRWLSEGFSGAVLGREEVAAAGGAAKQGETVTAFFKEGLRKARAMVRSAVTGTAD